MMLKIILYAHMNNIYACRKIERQVQRDIHYIWLSAQKRPDFVTINRFCHLPSVAVADSGSGSEENYRLIDEAGMEAYVKYNRFHLEQRPRHRRSPFHHDSFHYNKEEDYYVCPMGQHMTRIGTKHTTTASGYRSGGHPLLCAELQRLSPAVSLL